MTSNDFYQAFRQNSDGSWSTIHPIKLKTPQVQVTVMVDTGMIFRPGEQFLGLDIAGFLDGSHDESIEDMEIVKVNS